MKIEVLYDSVCGLYGDNFNTKYLSMCSDKIELINTDLNDKPAFLDKDVKMIYIGSMTERTEEIVIKKLMPYKDKIKSLIKKGVIFLVTGNAIEIFGESIYRNGREIKGLNIFDFYTKYDYENRYHELYLGKYEDIKIVGFKSQFSKFYNIKEEPLFKTIKGIGNDENTKNEGIRKNNFMATTVLGPILLQNPYFTKEILKLLGLSEDLKYEEDIIKAYNVRLKEYENLKF
jgi:CobQ-like glutamine amidotransferase family enzyme